MKSCRQIILLNLTMLFTFNNFGHKVLLLSDSYFEERWSFKNKWVSKEAVVSSCCGILLSNKNKVLIQVTTWMNHKEIKLGKKKKTPQEDT